MSYSQPLRSFFNVGNLKMRLPEIASACCCGLLIASETVDLITLKNARGFTAEDTEGAEKIS